MTEPFIGEIMIASFNFAPKYWALCNGQLLPINQNQALFSLFGTTYGGDGRVNFALPDLRGRTPIHMGNGHAIGERAGAEAVTLNISEIPNHNHNVLAVAAAPTANTPSGNSFANAAPGELYTNAAGNTTANAGTVTTVGGSQAHNNMQPTLTLNFCVALQGIFPSQN
ncbi:MAG: tail fiber protein [Bacteroidota bacterium]